MVVHLWEKHEEVPYIAAYRKQLAGELRALHNHDMPGTTESGDSSDAYPVGTMQVRLTKGRSIAGSYSAHVIFVYAPFPTLQCIIGHS